MLPATHTCRKADQMNRESPFLAPQIGIPDESEGLLPRSVESTGHKKWRLVASAGCSIVAVVAVVILVYFNRTYQVDGSVLVDHRPLRITVLLLGAAMASAAISVMLAIPVLLARNFIPVAWLLPLLLGGLWFLSWYDWEALGKDGKANDNAAQFQAELVDDGP